MVIFYICIIYFKLHSSKVTDPKEKLYMINYKIYDRYFCNKLPLFAHYYIYHYTYLLRKKKKKMSKSLFRSYDTQVSILSLRKSYPIIGFSF